jgi:hypothetical protein
VKLQSSSKQVGAGARRRFCVGVASGKLANGDRRTSMTAAEDTTDIDPMIVIFLHIQIKHEELKVCCSHP